MPRGDKSKYTDKQKRKAEHIAEGYTESGVGSKEAKRRAWATVNKDSGGGELSGSGRGKPATNEASRRGGRLGAAARRRKAASGRKTPSGARRSRSTSSSSRSRSKSSSRSRRR
jgi:plasmid stabilization system protein ParE